MQWYVTSILVFNQIVFVFLLLLKWNEYVIKFSINQANYENIWRYQSANLNPYIEEVQTTQWPKESLQRTNNDLQNLHIKLKIE
jgi:hypothetical protein